MKTKTLREQATFREALAVLLEHLEPAKVAKFLASLRGLVRAVRRAAGLTAAPMAGYSGRVVVRSAL